MSRMVHLPSSLAWGLSATGSGGRSPVGASAPWPSAGCRPPLACAWSAAGAPAPLLGTHLLSTRTGPVTR
eukprot:4009166-Alexandrium_andersonii.AAC.1